jgi:hypothetical protein
MAKSWKSFVQPQAAADKPDEAPAMPNWQELAQQNEALQQLMEERAQLEQRMQQLTGQPDAGAPPDRYSNEMPSFSERKKNDARWQAQRNRAQQKEAERQKEQGFWEGRKKAPPAPAGLKDKTAAKPKEPKRPERRPGPERPRQKAKAKTRPKLKGRAEKLLPPDAKAAIQKAKDTWQDRRALAQRKKDEWQQKKAQAKKVVEKLRALKKQVPPVAALVRQVKKDGLKETAQRVRKAAQKALGNEAKALRPKLEPLRKKGQALLKAKEQLRLEEKREQLREKLRLKKKLQEQFEGGKAKVADLMALKTDTEQKIKELRNMEKMGGDGFEPKERQKEEGPATGTDDGQRQPNETKAEERKQAEKEEQQRQQREEERRQQRREERQAQRREEKRQERKKDKYS